MTGSLTAALGRAGFQADEIPRREALFDMVERAAGELGLTGPEVRRYHAPGRIEVLGKHTDYAGGRSLVCATEQGIAFVTQPRDDLRIRVVDARLGQVREFALDPALEAPRGDWGNYPATVAARLVRDFGLRVAGLDLVFASDIPFAAGVSSSSALVVGIAWAMIDAGRLDQEPAFRANIATMEDLAGYLGAMENGRVFRGFPGGGGVGTMGGSQDQTAIVCSVADHLAQFRFDPVVREETVAWPEDHLFAVAASGVVAEKTGAALEQYNDLARMTAALRDLVAGDADRTATLGRILIDGDGQIGPAVTRINRLDDRVWAGRLESRLRQLLIECRTLIPAFRGAVERRDWSAVEAWASASQAGAESGLANQIEETRALVALALEEGAVAASAFGAGFGGSVWAMIGRHDADRFLAEWSRQYRDRFPAHDGSSFFTTRPAPPLIALAGRAPRDVVAPR